MLLIVSSASATGAFQTGDVPRNSDAVFADDLNGNVELDKETVVEAETTSRLVTATNHMGTDATVTVRLTEGSGDVADLVADGQKADSVSFMLVEAESQDVDIQADDAAEDKETLTYEVVVETPDGRRGVIPRSIRVD